MREIKKIYLTIVLVLALAFSLVIISSATSVMYNSSDSAFNDMIEESSNPTYADLMTGQYAGSYINYGNVSNGNFTIFVMTLASYENSYETYVYWVSDIEAFQTRYSGYSYDNFLTELDNNGYYDLSYRFNESGFTYLLNYQPVDTSTMVEWSDVNSTIHEWYVDDFGGTIYENVNVESISTLNAFLNDNATYTKDLLVDDLNSKNNTIDSLHSEIDTLTVEIENVRSEGYAQGMADADAVERGALTIISAPLYIITSIFNVDIFGINLLTLLTTIMTIVVVAWVIKKLAN